MICAQMLAFDRLSQRIERRNAHKDSDQGMIMENKEPLTVQRHKRVKPQAGAEGRRNSGNGTLLNGSARRKLQ